MISVELNLSLVHMQYDTGTSAALQVSVWRWNRLEFYYSIALSALFSINFNYQLHRLSKNFTSDRIWLVKKHFPWGSQHITLTVPETYNYCMSLEPGFSVDNLIIKCVVMFTIKF